MAAQGTPLSGKDGGFTVAGLELNFDKWNATYTVTDLPTPTFKAGGFDQGSFGFHKLEGEGEGFWDAGQNPQASPPKLRPGVYGTTLQLFLSKTLNVYVNLPAFRILSVTWTVETDTIIRFSVKFKSHGTFDMPGGFTPTPLTTS